MIIKKISIDEYSRILSDIPRYNFLCSEKYIKLISNIRKVNIFVGYEDERPVIVTPIVYLPYKKIFKFGQIYFGPLFVGEVDNKTRILKTFLKYIRKYHEKDFSTIALQISSPVIKEYYNGFDKLKDNDLGQELLDVYKNEGYIHIPYTFYDEESLKYNMMIDSVYVKKIECDNFEELFKTFNTSKVGKHLIEEYNIKVKELNEEGPEIIRKYVDAIYDSKDINHIGYVTWLDEGKKYFGDDMKFVISYIDKDADIEMSMNKNNEIIKNNMQIIIEAEKILSDEPNNKKAKRKLEQANDQVNGARKRNLSLENIKKRISETGGDIILTASLFIKAGDEVFFVSSGRDYDISKDIKANIIYPVHEYIFKYAIENGIKYYNFYGTSPNFSKKSKDYGVQLSKSIFNGNIETYIGSFYLRTSKITRLLMKNYNDL